MLKRLLLTALAATLAAGISFANEPTGKVVLPVDKTQPNDGKEMFTSYCAPCHGADGKGHGSVAAALKKQPTDLTELARNNQGKYPDRHIVAVLEFGSEVQAHGSEQMPVWGPILGKMKQTDALDKQLRISNLSRYLKSIQAQ